MPAKPTLAPSGGTHEFWVAIVNFAEPPSELSQLRHFSLSFFKSNEGTRKGERGGEIEITSNCQLKKMAHDFVVQYGCSEHRIFSRKYSRGTPFDSSILACVLKNHFCCPLSQHGSRIISFAVGQSILYAPRPLRPAGTSRRSPCNPAVKKNIEKRSVGGLEIKKKPDPYSNPFVTLLLSASETKHKFEIF